MATRTLVGAKNKSQAKKQAAKTNATRINSATSSAITTANIANAEEITNPIAAPTTATPRSPSNGFLSLAKLLS